MTLLQPQWSNKRSIDGTARLPTIQAESLREDTPTKSKVLLVPAFGLLWLISTQQLMAQADLPGSFVNPARVLTLVEGREEYSLGDHLDFLEDPSHQLNINEVASPEWKDKFVPSRQQVPAIGYTDAAVWVRCQVSNPTAESAEWIVELGWRPREVTFFRLSDKGAAVARQAGRHVPFSLWEIRNRFPSFRLPLPAQSNQTFYLQIISSGTNIHLPLRLFSISAFAQRWSTDSLLGGIFFGILVFTTGYGLLIYFFLREKSYAYLAAMGGAYCLYRVTADGWSSLCLWPHLVQPHLVTRDLSLLAIYVFGILFSQAFLETRRQVPLLHRVMTASILIYGVVSIVDLVFPVLGGLFKPLETGLLVLMMAAGFIRWKQGFQAARFFLLAWIGFSVCRLIIVLAQVLLLTATWPARAQDFAWVTVVFLWAVALADRVNLLKQEKQNVSSVLKDSEERFRLVAERTGHMIYDLDIASGRAQWAGAVTQVSGYSLEEFQQIDLNAYKELVHPEDREEAIVLFERAMATGQSCDAEYRFRRKDGTYIILQDNGTFLKDDRGRSIRMLGIMNDVTERRKAQDLILRVGRSIGAHTGQSFLRSLVTELARALEADYAFIAELKQNLPGRVQTVAVFAKGQVAENFEYDLRHTPCENVMNDSICSYPNEVQTAFPLDDLLKEMKVEGYVGTPLLDSTGRTNGLMAVLSCQPIANVNLAESVLQIFAARAAAELERLGAEAQIRALNAGLEQRVRERTAQLEYANRELEAFSYSVSHDLGAPLRNISGFVQLLQKRVNGSLDEKAERYLETISDESRRMGTLIESLLDFSKLSRTEPQKTAVDLNRLVAEIQQQFLFEIQDRSIEWRIEALPVVLGDWDLLKQVLANFLSNAIKYTRTRPRAQITVGCQRGSSEEVVIFVRDNGVGFNMKHASKLFGVFQRLHSVKEFEGTGIGLANAQRIIHRHRGRVWAEAEEDRGAVFFFTLPR